MSCPMSATSVEPTGAGSAGLWLRLAAAPAVWILQGLIGWGLGAGMCGAWSVGLVRTSLAIVGLLALACATAGLLSSLSQWRVAGHTEQALDQPRAFFIFAGVFVSSAFVVGILWGTLNALLITACGATR